MEQASGSGPPPPAAERDMGFAERSLAAAGAAVVSAVLVNPLDVAKVRTVVWSGAAAGPALSLTRVPRAPVVATCVAWIL